MSPEIVDRLTDTVIPDIVILALVQALLGSVSIVLSFRAVYASFLSAHSRKFFGNGRLE